MHASQQGGGGRLNVSKFALSGKCPIQRAREEASIEERKFEMKSRRSHTMRRSEIAAAQRDTESSKETQTGTLRHEKAEAMSSHGHGSQDAPDPRIASKEIDPRNMMPVAG